MTNQNDTTTEIILPSKIAERYTNLVLLGEGGMGKVYKAWDTVTRRNVAIKVVGSAIAGDKKRLQRFRREALALSRVKNEHVVKVFDFEQEGEVACYTMECVQGIPLSHIIDDGETTPKEFVGLIVQLADGVVAVHSADVLHRDIKPDNVLVDDDAVLKLMDFGLAFFTDNIEHTKLTKTGFFVGSMGYVPPETMLGEEPDVRSDVYQIGVVLYEGLTGTIPVPHEDIVKYVEDGFPLRLKNPASLNPEVDETLDKIVMKAISPDPNNRYSSVARFRNALKAWLEGREVKTRAFSAVAPKKKRDEKNKKDLKKKRRKKKGRKKYEEDEGDGRAALLAAAVVGGLVTIPILLAALFGPEEAPPSLQPSVTQRATQVASRPTRKATRRPRRLPGTLPKSGPARSVTPLHKAALAGDKEKIQRLINDGADVLAKDSNGDTPLHYAARKGKVEIVTLLATQGANPSAKNHRGDTPARVARRHNHFDVVVALAFRELSDTIPAKKLDLEEEIGPEPPAPPPLPNSVTPATKAPNVSAVAIAESTEGWTPIFEAAWKGDEKATRKLLRGNLDLNKSDKTGRTPLFIAAYRGHKKIVAALLKKGVKVNATDARMRTALHMAAWNGHHEIAEMLLKNGASVDSRSVTGQTPLSLACNTGWYDVIALLITKGATIEATDKTGNTPLHEAAASGYLDVCQLLVLQGASLDVVNQGGLSPIDEARWNNHKPIVDYLRKQASGR